MQYFFDAIAEKANKNESCTRSMQIASLKDLFEVSTRNDIIPFLFLML
jgi:hypothetical protein